MSYSREKMTIDDIAQALGISKTTVSRSISGKGRISEDTRKKVIDYIKAHDYTPNPIARGLAQAKTYNLGWVVPGDVDMSSLPFFQLAMIGMSEAAASDDYDILLTMVYDNDISRLEKMIKNRKVDGVVLGRTLEDDINIKTLVKSGIPFVVIGSSNERGVIQIDNDHINACSELTSIIVMKGAKKLALICDSSDQIVNNTRSEGLIKGLASRGMKPSDALIYMDCDTNAIIERAVDEALRNGADCLICTDDHICHTALVKLSTDNIQIPNDVKIASFYNSSLLERNQPPITSLQYDPRKLGFEAARTLIDCINGKEVPQKKLMGYEVVLKGSTL